MRRGRVRVHGLYRLRLASGAIGAFLLRSVRRRVVRPCPREDSRLAARTSKALVSDLRGPGKEGSVTRRGRLPGEARAERGVPILLVYGAVVAKRRPKLANGSGSE